MNKTAKVAIGVGLGAFLLGALVFTVFNKRWMGRRITARWDVVTGTEPGDPWTVYGPDWSKWTLPQLYAAWANGKPGWFPHGQRPDMETEVEFDVA